MRLLPFRPSPSTRIHIPLLRPVLLLALLLTPLSHVTALAASAPDSAGKPVAATIHQGVPVGLYFMTRFWASSGSLEKSVWYFAPDGTTYEKLEYGFSPEDLDAHRGTKGHAKADAGKLEVTWANGKTTSSTFTPSGKGFSWNGGIFTAVKPFDGGSIAGVYEGGESLSGGGGRAIVSKRLELRADGTFSWRGVSFLGSTTKESKVSASATGGETKGTWKVGAFSLTLSDNSGNVLRRIAFPYDDEKTPIKPDYIFFGGLMYKRQAQ